MWTIFLSRASLTPGFSLQLMLMMSHVENENSKGRPIDCISWARDGHTFIIRDRKELVDSLMPLFFREGKFSSFTRKLYRWGFRQICIPKGLNKKDREIIFGHEHFQRDDKALMFHMRSVTAAGTRRAIAALTSRKKARENSKESVVRKKASKTKYERTTIKPLPCLGQAEQFKSLPSKPEQILPTHKASSPRTTTRPGATLGALLKSRSKTSMAVPGRSGLQVQKPPTMLSSGNALTDLLKAKSHSLMAPPAQNNMLSMQSSAALHGHMGYLRAIAQSSRASSNGSMNPPNFAFGAKTSFANHQQLASTNGKIASQAFAAARNIVFSDTQIQQPFASRQRISASPSEFLRNAQLSKLSKQRGHFASKAPTAPNMVLPNSQLHQIAASGSLTSRAHAVALLQRMSGPSSTNCFASRAVASTNLGLPDARQMAARSGNSSSLRSGSIGPSLVLPET